MTVNYVCIRNDQRWVSCQHCDDRYLVPSSQFFELSVSRNVQLNALRNNRNQPTSMRSGRLGEVIVQSTASWSMALGPMNEAFDVPFEESDLGEKFEFLKK